MKKIPLVYILSTGRSGSTLLDMLLGMHPNVWTLGEAQILPWEVRDNRTPCGCGKPVSTCEFWSAALPNIPLDHGNYPIEYFREGHTFGRTIRWNHLLDIVRRTPSKRWSVGIAEYGLKNAEYFSAVTNVAIRRCNRPVVWLVDASKDIYRLFWLEQSGWFDIRVIHLIKDPRAFAYSMTKTPPQSFSESPKYAGRWYVQNLLSSFIIYRIFPGRSLQLRYEDLASDTETAMLSIGRLLDIVFQNEFGDRFRDYENHAISGNPMRWQNTRIRLDQSWRSNFPQHYARVVWLLTASLARRFGYTYR